MLTISNFVRNKDSKDGFHSLCKSCQSKNYKEYYKKNRERILKRQKDDYHNRKDVHKERNRWSKIKMRYGITRNDYDILFKNNNGKCHICNNEEVIVNKPLSVDHNHKTGSVRGLLCHNCNLLLGACRDNIFILIKSIEYLLKDKRGGGSL